MQTNRNKQVKCGSQYYSARRPVSIHNKIKTDLPNHNLPSSTPLQWSWCSTKWASKTPPVLISFGIMQRTKCGCVASRVFINLSSCSLWPDEMVFCEPDLPFLPPASSKPTSLNKCDNKALPCDSLKSVATVMFIGSLFFSSQPSTEYATTPA